VPGLSPEYSREGRLQTVITAEAITNAARNTLIRAGLVTVGQISHGPPVHGEDVKLVDFDRAFVLQRRVRRGMHWSSSIRRLRLARVCYVDIDFIVVTRRRRHRAKGSVFAFAPTFSLRGTSSTKSSGAEDTARWWRRCPRSKW
jgi:hypothetical protein